MSGPPGVGVGGVLGLLVAFAGSGPGLTFTVLILLASTAATIYGPERRYLRLRLHWNVDHCRHTRAQLRSRPGAEKDFVRRLKHLLVSVLIEL